MKGLRRDAGLESVVNEALRAATLHELCNTIQVLWNSRMRTTAGLAIYSRGQIVLNPALHTAGDGEIRRTLLHELAHFVARHRTRNRRLDPHGPEWRRACADLGIPGESRCHNLPFPRREQARKHFYQCPVCSVVIARVRPLKRPSACLSCCRMFNGGNYDSRFRFQTVTQNPPEGLFSQSKS
jgi:SprT protein